MCPVLSSVAPTESARLSCINDKNAGESCRHFINELFNYKICGMVH